MRRAPWARSATKVLMCLSQSGDMYYKDSVGKILELSVRSWGIRCTISAGSHPMFSSFVRYFPAISKLDRTFCCEASALTDLPQSSNTLLQPCALRLRFFQDGNLGIGVLPKSEEVLVVLASLGDVTLHCISAGHAEMRKHAERVSNHDSAVIHNVLKFPGGFGTLAGGQVCLAAHIDRIEGSKICKCGAARTA